MDDSCNHNWEQGYRLVDWKLDRIGDPDTMLIETIIAVFELREP